MDKINLLIPTKKDEQAVMEFRQEFFDNGEMSMNGDGSLDKAKSYDEWLTKIHDEMDPNTCPSDRVPATTYIAVREIDNKIIGTIQIRHYLKGYLLTHGGHIGYGVRPSERRKGYASQMLRLALDKCLELGIDKALVTCDKSNIASSSTAKSQGGILENTIMQDDGESLERYWIKCKKEI